jgi:hypothetical protein
MPNVPFSRSRSAHALVVVVGVLPSRRVITGGMATELEIRPSKPFSRVSFSRPRLRSDWRRLEELEIRLSKQAVVKLPICSLLKRRPSRGVQQHFAGSGLRAWTARPLGAWGPSSPWPGGGVAGRRLSPGRTPAPWGTRARRAEKRRTHARPGTPRPPRSCSSLPTGVGVVTRTPALRLVAEGFLVRTGLLLDGILDGLCSRALATASTDQRRRHHHRRESPRHLDQFSTRWPSTHDNRPVPRPDSTRRERDHRVSTASLDADTRSLGSATRPGPSGPSRWRTACSPVSAVSSILLGRT